MQINKFGGASIKDAESIKHMVSICKSSIKTGVIVVSAIGKSTNKLEKIVEAYLAGENTIVVYDALKQSYLILLDELFANEHSINDEVDLIFSKLEKKLMQPSSDNYDFEYDQIVSFGELLSGPIIAAKLNETESCVHYIDATTIIQTDSNYREGEVNWGLTKKKIYEQIAMPSKKLYLTQGFIASDFHDFYVTLGREGSDYTAAILGSILKAEQVSVWKDVPGIMCADPAWMPGCEVLKELSYHESIELAFYGAKVIHPKTIKPLQNGNIPLYVRSFKDLEAPGSKISGKESTHIPPVYVRIQNQILITIWQINYSFIVERNLGHIFNLFDKYKIKVNLMQNSAISFSVCVDGELVRVKSAIKELKESYHVKYNDNLELISVRHIKSGIEDKITKGRDILLEQKSRSMARFVMKMHE